MNAAHGAASAGVGTGSTPTVICVEAALDAYVPLLAALHGACFDKGWSVDEMASMVRMPGTLAFLAENAGEPAGLALIRLVCDEGEILTLGVVPRRRRRGVGKALVSALITKGAERGARRLFLEVAADNPTARTLYEAAGFFPIGRRRGYYERPGSAGADALSLVREIAAPTASAPSRSDHHG